MNTKKDIRVTINHKDYVISGFESEEYLKKVAAYLNQKYLDFRTSTGYGRLNSDMRGILMNLNLADDYFKALEQVKEMEEFRKEDGKELFLLKHEKIALEAERDQLKQELETWKKTR